MDPSIFVGIERPSRYLGEELNVIVKDWDSTILRIALSYPDLYEVGMSHMGLPILYHYLNNIKGVLAERVFSPAKDFESTLRKKNISLFSLENKKPIKEFDILGFSLLSELTYTNLLNILELSNIEIFSKNRDDNEPIVFAGGVNVFNPEPIAPFVDVFFIGDAEAVFFSLVERIRDLKGNGYGRKEILERISGEKGVYIPALHKVEKKGDFFIPVFKNGRKIKKAYLKDLDKFPLPEKPLVPTTEIIFDRLSIEIARGCPQRCRFCQASFVYHPFRWRDPNYLITYIEKTVKESGFEDFSLSSLSTADYPYIEKLMYELVERLEKEKVGIGLPSLRPKMIKEFMLELIKRTRKTGFTIVPEAGTERLRKVINKYVDDGEVFHSLEMAYKYGWRAVKFYFMIGLPTETEEDIKGIGEILLKALELGRTYRRRLRIGATISVFIPKPHTPFQWCEFASKKEIKRKKEILLNMVKDKREIFLKFHPYETAYIETLLSRGDRRVSKIIYLAFKKGAKFDAWDSEFDFVKWESAIEESKVDVSPFFRKIEIEEDLPWEHVDTGVRKEYLIEEYRKSKKEERTISCIERDCEECKGCYIPIRIVKDISIETKEADKSELEFSEKRYFRYVISYKKKDSAVFLSSLETVRAIERTLRRSPFDFAFTEGFHPKIKISFLFADPLGVEIEEDIFEVRSTNVLSDRELSHLTEITIRDLSFFDIKRVKPDSPRLSKIVKEIVFKVSKKEIKSSIKFPDFKGVFPEYKENEERGEFMYFTFSYNPQKKFTPYKFFKEIMKEYSPFKISKHRIILKEEFFEDK